MKKFNQFSKKKKRSLHNYVSCIKSKVALVFLKETLFIYFYFFFLWSKNRRSWCILDDFISNRPLGYDCVIGNIAVSPRSIDFLKVGQAVTFVLRKIYFSIMHCNLNYQFYN